MAQTISELMENRELVTSVDGVEVKHTLPEWFPSSFKRSEFDKLVDLFGHEAIMHKALSQIVIDFRNQCVRPAWNTDKDGKALHENPMEVATERVAKYRPTAPDMAPLAVKQLRPIWGKVSEEMKEKLLAGFSEEEREAILYWLTK